jgi:hypothetical protein
MPYNETPSAVSSKTRSASDQVKVQDYDGLIYQVSYDTITDGVQSDFEASVLKSLFMMGNMSKDTLSQGNLTRPGGQVPLNDDDNEIPMLTNRRGFDYLWQAYQFRLGYTYTKRMEEEDSIGEIARFDSYLRDAAKRTLRETLIDALDRGVDPTTAPFLCEDGLGLIDSGRPNPDPNAGTWSNLFSSGEISISMLNSARLAVSRIPHDNGDRSYQNIDTIYIPDTYENSIRVVLGTANDVGTAINDINPEYNRGWKYKVIPELRANNIFYSLTGVSDPDKGLKFLWRIAPEIDPIRYEDPHKKGAVLRFRFAYGCDSPRFKLAGGPLDSL